MTMVVVVVTLGGGCNNRAGRTLCWFSCAPRNDLSYACRRRLAANPHRWHGPLRACHGRAVETSSGGLGDGIRAGRISGRSMCRGATVEQYVDEVNQQRAGSA